MASSSTQVEDEVIKKQGEETIKELLITEEKAATQTDGDQVEQATVHDDQEDKVYEDEEEAEIKEYEDDNDDDHNQSPINIDEEDDHNQSPINIDEEADHDHATTTFDGELEVGEFDHLDD